MEIKCTKCRYKFDVIPEDGQQEMTAICPRCGASQTLTMPPAIPIPATETPQPYIPEVTPEVHTNDIPEEHLKYIPHENAVESEPASTEPLSQKDEVIEETKPTVVPQPVQEKEQKPQNTTKKVQGGGTNNSKRSGLSCGKMFALGCFAVAVLAVLTIAILAFAGKNFFNSISSNNDDEQEQVDRTDRNIVIQPEETTPSTSQQPIPATQQPSPNTPQITDTGGEGNDNTAVQEPVKPTEEQKQRADKDVATAGGSYNCQGTIDGKNIDLKLNVTSGGFVTGKLTDNTTGNTLDITGDRYGDDYYLTASNSTELIKLTLKKQGRTLKGTAKKELQNMPVSVTY